MKQGETKILSNTTIAKAKQISEYAQEFCLVYYQSGRCIPKEILPYLVEKRVFNKVDARNGLKLRQVLRDVDDAGMLSNLIPQVEVERKPKNRFWFFRAV